MNKVNILNILNILCEMYTVLSHKGFVCR